MQTFTKQGSVQVDNDRIAHDFFVTTPPNSEFISLIADYRVSNAGGFDSEISLELVDEGGNQILLLKDGSGVTSGFAEAVLGDFPSSDFAGGRMSAILSDSTDADVSTLDEFTMHIFYLEPKSQIRNPN